MIIVLKGELDKEFLKIKLQNSNLYKNKPTSNRNVVMFKGSLNNLLNNGINTFGKLNLKTKFNGILNKFSKLVKQIKNVLISKIYNINFKKEVHSIGDYSLNKYIDKITQNGKGLNADEIDHINKKLLFEKHLYKENKHNLLDLGRILDYDKMRKEGRSIKDIKRYVNEDTQAIAKARKFSKQNKELHERMFGYPANMKEDSTVTKYLRKKEANLYLMNNCGDPYERGNYQMDSKDYEKDVLKLFYKKFGVDPDKGWGYITSGGSESNKWGIFNGFKKYPNGRLYFCESSHYSVEKVVTNGSKTFYPYSVISQENKFSEKIDKNKLLKEVKKNWDEKKEPAVLLLTWGTTKAGSIDNVKEITTWLNKNNIPHYIHLDAALHGSIPKNQKAAPVISSLDKLGIDSASASLHKYFGMPDVNSVVIATEKGIGKHISYIGQTDSTTAGSRSFHPFSTLQKVKETLERSLPAEYEKNINVFENLLRTNKVNFKREKLSNMFVIKKPSDDLCKYFQLSTYKDQEGNELAHVVIFPYHKKESMIKLAKSLATDDLKKKNVNTLKEVKQK